ncbi:DUF3789 domain-containing protein [Sediminibacillus massiliensis]|nr:DUF3789 domain-containing protein [Sediminibacillus massiliensis]
MAGFILGLFAGSMTTLFIMSLMVVAKRADESIKYRN